MTPTQKQIEFLKAELVETRRERDEARMLQASADEETRRVRADLEAAERERDEALANYQFMVARAADQKLDGYRELAARAADAENRRDEALRAVSAQIEENERLRVSIAEAEQRGRDAERADVVAYLRSGPARLWSTQVECNRWAQGFADGCHVGAGKGETC